MSYFKLLHHPIFIIFTGLVTISDSYSQSVKRQTISSFGAVQSSDQTTYSQTAGQSYNTSMGTGENITSGFQQPLHFQIEKVSSAKHNNLDITVFPNPATYSITVSSATTLPQSIIQVHDIQGRTILNTQVSDLTQHKIDCSQWIPGSYVIHVMDGKGNQKVLKLIISK